MNELHIKPQLTIPRVIGCLSILVGCEESQAVCIELRKLGHEAYSCDLQECKKYLRMSFNYCIFVEN